MKRGQPTKLGAVLLIIVVAAVMIGGIIWAGRMLFGGGSSKVEVNTGQKLLTEPKADTAVRMSVRGPIVAEEVHYSIIITINSSSRTITTYKGYKGEVIETQTLDNTKAAFDDLLAALNRAGYMEENASITQDPEGICAVGQLIQFEVLDGDKSAKKLWTTSCAKLEGTFAGRDVNVEALFQNQIPESRAIIQRAKKIADQ